MRLRKILEERLQIIRRQRFEPGGHDRELRGVQARDVLALDDVFLCRGVQNFHGRLCFSIEAAREGRLLYREAYELTGLYGATFDRYAKELAATR